MLSIELIIQNDTIGWENYIECILTQKYRTGSILVDEGDAQEYMFFFLKAIAFFFGTLIMFNYIFTVVSHKRYLQKEEVDQRRYLCYWVSNVHNLGIVLLCSYTLFNWQCPIEKGRFTWHSNEACFLIVEK